MVDARPQAPPRRQFIRQLVGLRLTAPMAAMLLTEAGLAQAQSTPYMPTQRGAAP